MNPLITKARSLNLKSKTPRSTARRLETNKKAQEGHLEEGKTTRQTKGSKTANQAKMAKG
jgi:hypothetical protein